MSDELNRKLDEIVREHLRIKTLDTQDSDRLDFHEVAVWTLREALVAAYNEGVKDGWKAISLPLGVSNRMTRGRI